MPSTSEPPISARKLVVLLVEDDHDVRDAITEALTVDGYRVLAVHDGQEALALLAQLRPHLILLDLMLPMVSGWEVLAEISSNRALADIPVVVVSAYADRAPLKVTHILRKPIGIDELRETVRRFCA